MNTISFKDKIPGHPRECKGVKSSTYTPDQCRMCWLATYNLHYRRLWKISLPKEIEYSVGPEEYYGCIHRNPEKVVQPGCSSCSGISYVHKCSSEKAGPGWCFVELLGKGSSLSRNNGYRACAECGFREPEADLEMPVVQFMELLNKDPSVLPDGWRNWKVTTQAYKTALLEQSNASYSYPRKKYNGRGIVIGAGGEIYFKCALASVAALRASGCFLPVQFWYLGREEMDARMVNYARSIGVECVDASSVVRTLEKKPRILYGWELKAFAMIHCPFEEVMYLDADCIVARDPSYLFSTEQYLEHGSIFWPDLSNTPAPAPSKQFWESHGMFADPGPDFESGQMVINKGRCWRELQVSQWINEHSDWFYQHMYGDKSTFRVAWRACGTSYAMPQMPDWRWPSIEQYDFEGNLVFQHCCQGKPHLVEGHELSVLKYSQVVLEAKNAWSKSWPGSLYYPNYKAIEGLYKIESTGEVLDFKPCGKVEVTITGSILVDSLRADKYRWGVNADELVLIGLGKRYPGEGRSWRKGVIDFLKRTDNGWKGSKITLVPAS